MAEAQANSDVLVSLRGVCKEYRLHGVAVAALREVNLDVMAGEYLSVMGPSGSGKSTLFNMIGALDQPTSGAVVIGGAELGRLASAELAFFRNHYIGYVFQNFNLLPWLTALRNVALPLLLRGAPPREAETRAAALLKRVGLEHRLQHRPSELSGGQQQRVAIARALANDPVIILADEPTGNLDLRTGEQIIAMLSELSRAQGVTVISATHDHKMLATSDRVAWIQDGRLMRVARRAELDIKVGSIDGATSW